MIRLILAMMFFITPAFAESQYTTQQVILTSICSTEKAVDLEAKAWNPVVMGESMVESMGVSMWEIPDNKIALVFNNGTNKGCYVILKDVQWFPTPKQHEIKY